MPFRVYSGPQGTPDVPAIDKEHMLFKELGSLDDALLWARFVEKRGRTPLLIEGDDGTRMDRRSIVNALRVGSREEVGQVH